VCFDLAGKAFSVDDQMNRADREIGTMQFDLMGALFEPQGITGLASKRIPGRIEVQMEIDFLGDDARREPKGPSLARGGGAC
jgi:hypothetical protein